MRRLHFEHLILRNSITHIRQGFKSNVNCCWHFHQEMELVYFHRGSGRQYVGDHHGTFNSGDLVMVGPNIPHFWQFDATDDKSGKGPFSTVLHLNECLWIQPFLNLPEMEAIESLREKSKFGIRFNSSFVKKQIGDYLNICNLDNTEKIMAVISLLYCLATTDEYMLLSTSYNSADTKCGGLEFVEKTMRYIRENYHKKISLSEIAKITSVAPTSFCRIFKEKTGKSLFCFLKEYRIGMACRLFDQGESGIKNICYQVGFNSPSLFSKFFKECTGMTPNAYRRTNVYSQ